VFVAPNGFGKSSFSVAFKSLNPTKIILDDDHYYQSNDANKPEIALTYINSQNQEETLVATESLNQLRNGFSWFVINSQVFAKARKSKIGSTIVASASLEIPPIVLYNQIPENKPFSYSITSQRNNLGANGKVLRNLTDLFNNLIFLKKLEESFDSLVKATGQRVQRAMQMNFGLGLMKTNLQR
jgi:hypothetical protein